MNIRHTAANIHRVMLYTVPVSKKLNIAVSYSTYKNVKCTIVQALRLCIGRTVHRGSRCMALPFLDHGTRADEGSAARPDRFTTRKDPVPILQEAGLAAWPVWRGAENLAPTGIRSPYRPARSQSLHRLSHRGPLQHI